MSLLIILTVTVVWYLAIAVVKESGVKARYRWEDRVMEDHLAAEAALAHQWRLEAIDRSVNTTTAEMRRIAAEARGEVIEGTAVELDRP
jgi:hypothetical protein